MAVSTKYLSDWRFPFANPLPSDDQLEMYAEQVRENTQKYSQYSHINETPIQFQSTKDSHPFECPIYALDPSRVVVFYDDADNPRMREFITERQILFPVHPANEAAPKIEEIVSGPITGKTWVFPTASTRTVRIWDSAKKEGFKLDLHRRISRFDRRLGPGTIGHAIEVSKRLAAYLRHSPDLHTAIMKEDFGAAFVTERNPKLQGWGYLHREMDLYPALSKRTSSVPLFSLYGIDPAAPDTPPLLARILDPYESNKERIEAVLENVYFPIIRSWTSVFQNTGIALEPHGQNSRIEFVRDGKNYLLTGRIGHIDFDAAVIKKMLDRLDIEPSNLYSGQLVTEDNGHEISTIYDKSMGKMLFDQIASLLQTRYKIDPKILQKRCQSEFARCFPDSDEFFPEKTYKYTADPIAENTFGYVCTGEDPTWRPSKKSFAQ